MKASLLFISLFIFTNAASAQSEEQIEAFGKALFEEITDTANVSQVRYIRIKEYHALIDDQPLSDNQKAVLKQRINDNYTGMYVAYQKSMKELVDAYREDLKDGAEYEYLNTRSVKMDGSDDSFEMQTTLIYRKDRLQSRVKLNYDAAWLGREMVLITSVREEF